MTDIITVDNFVSDPAALRATALGLDFQTRKHGGMEYHGIGLHDLDLSAEIEKAVGFPVKQRLAFFRLNLAPDMPSTYIHADSGESEFAGVLHLTAPEHCGGGTAFWKSRWTGKDHVDGPLTDYEIAEYVQKGRDEIWWELQQVAEMKFNRFVTYPANKFHSRYPKCTWGRNKESGRLIWAVFYDRA